MIIQTVQNFISHFDYFGAELKLNLHNKNKYKSSVGGIFSLLMYTLLMYLFITKIQLLYNNESFQVITKTLNNINPSENYLNSENFMLAFKISSPDFIEDSDLKLQIIAINDIIEEDGTKTRIQKLEILEQCTVDHFGRYNFNQDNYLINTIQEYFCLPKEYAIPLKGTYGSSNFKFFRVQLSYKGSGLTQEQLLSDQAFSINTVIMSQYANFNQQYNIIDNFVVSDFYLETGSQTEQYSDIFLSFGELQSINQFNLLFEDKKQENFVQFSTSNIRTQQFVHRNPDNLFTLNFRLSQQQDILEIQYYSLSEFVSFMGGMLKFFTTILGIIAFNYNQLGFHVELANDLYEFNILEKTNEGTYELSFKSFQVFVTKQVNQVKQLIANFGKGTKKLINVSRLLKTQFMPLSNTPDQTLKPLNSEFHRKQTKTQSTYQEIQVNFLDSIFTSYINARRTIYIGWTFILRYLLFCCKSNYVAHRAKLLYQCEQMIRHDLNIVIILDKIQQVSKLKRVILNKEQLKLFNFTPKPIVDINYQLQQVTLQDDNQLQLLHWKDKKHLNIVGKVKNFNTKKRLNSLYHNFLKIKTENTEIDQRLIALLGESIQQIFECANELQNIHQQNKQPSLSPNEVILNTLTHGKQLSDDGEAINFD